MRMVSICCIVLTLNIVLLSQSREEKLEQLKTRSDIKVTEVEPNIFKLEYPDRKVLYKNIGNYQPPTTNSQQPMYSPTFDSTIIDLTTIDTTLYFQKYTYWQEVPIHNWDFDCLRIGDVNKNKKPELYGCRKFFWSQAEPITIYELNNSDDFVPVHQYDSVYIARSIYDVDKDDEEEVLLTLTPIFDTVGNQQRFFSKVSDTSLATSLNFVLTYYGAQINVGAQLNDIMLGNFDEDQFTDLIFSTSGYSDVHIFEYNSSINQFDSVYRFDINDMPPEKGGFSIGYFDLDGETDFVLGTISGKVYVLENEGNDQYTNTWQGNVESYNAYIHTWTNDIDKNGKSEFWVLGDAYYNGVGTTKITIFEAYGDNSYQAVGRVDLVGIFSFYAGTMQAVDINDDGIDEIAVCIDDNFLILKFNGSKNHHTYEVYYIKQNELNTKEEFQVYFGATMAVLKSSPDEDFEILISMIHIIEQPGEDLGRYITRIYQPDSVSNVKTAAFIPINSELHQNFPNPFNPTTTISYSIQNAGEVSLKVYDMLGTEVASLVNENQEAGNYSLTFNAAELPSRSGSALTSGIYFYTLTSGNFMETKKLILLK